MVMGQHDEGATLGRGGNLGLGDNHDFMAVNAVTSHQ